MIKLIVGAKGSGKTKTLIEMANKAAQESKGNVVCVEKGDKLARELPTNVRLVNSEEYQIQGFASLYGFLAGFLAGNYEITKVLHTWYSALQNSIPRQRLSLLYPAMQQTCRLP